VPAVPRAGDGAEFVKVEREPQTVAEIREAAQRWYESELTRSERALGPAWPAMREWIDSYLKEQLRQRLIARGWRPRAR
jgi:hypothetical protein